MFLYGVNLPREAIQVNDVTPPVYSFTARNVETRDRSTRGEKDERNVQACQITPCHWCSGIADCNECMLEYQIMSPNWY